MKTVVIVINSEKNATQSHNKILPHICHYGLLYQQKQNKSGVDKNVEKLEPLYTVGGIQNDAASMEKVWRFLTKLKIELSYDSAILLLNTERNKITILKRY